MLVVAIGIIIAVYIWKNRVIQKKRRGILNALILLDFLSAMCCTIPLSLHYSGSNDVEKLVKTLNDSSLNFKYSTIEKATDSFSEANRLGQGGFGTVYKVRI